MKYTSGDILNCVYRAFEEQMRAEQMFSLTGYGHYHYDADTASDCTDEECYGTAPLIDVKYDIELAEIELGRLALHKHEWDESGFCWCGWDGNA